MSSQPLLLEWTPPVLTLPKMTDTQSHVYEVMKDGHARTIWGIQALIESRFKVHYMETTISAKLRDLRKLGFNVPAPRCENKARLYRIVPVTPE